MRVGGIILCGGKSSRMGYSKAILPFGPELMLQRVVRLLSEVVSPIVVVAAPTQELPPFPSDVLIARDQREGRGPLEGLLAGLSHARRHSGRGIRHKLRRAPAGNRIRPADDRATGRSTTSRCLSKNSFSIRWQRSIGRASCHTSPSCYPRPTAARLLVRPRGHHSRACRRVASRRFGLADAEQPQSPRGIRSGTGSCRVRGSAGASPATRRVGRSTAPPTKTARGSARRRARPRWGGRRR